MLENLYAKTDPKKLMKMMQVIVAACTSFLLAYLLSGQFVAAIAAMGVFGLGAYFFLFTDIGASIFEALWNQEKKEEEK